jgi:hypothetical protein
VLEERGLFMEQALPELDVPDDAAAAEQRRAAPLPSPLKKGEGVEVRSDRIKLL